MSTRPSMLRLTGLALLLGLAAIAVAPMADAQADAHRDTLDAAVYADLLARMRAGDTGIDFRLLRLSQTVSGDYAPYDGPAKRRERRMFDLLFEAGDAAAGLALADSALAQNALRLDAQYGAAVAHDMLGDSTRAGYHFAVFQGLVDSILHTAEGTQADPFVVTSVDEAYTLVGTLGLDRTSQTLVECNGAPCDEMELRDPRDGAVLTFYFDVSIPFGHMRRTLATE